MKYAIIESGIVVNIAVAEKPLAENWIASDDASIGEFYSDGEFNSAPVDVKALAQAAREKRNALLADSDWTQLTDAPVDQAAWATYRQALRDVTQQSGFPWTITWPTQPE